MATTGDCESQSHDMQTTNTRMLSPCFVKKNMHVEWLDAGHTIDLFLCNYYEGLGGLAQRLL